MLLALSSDQKLGLALVAGAFVAFALVSSIVIPRSNPAFPGRKLGLFLGASVAFTVAMLLTVAFVAKETGGEGQPAAAETQGTTETTQPTQTTPTTEASEGDPAAGKTVFVSTCGGCHTLADAGTTGTVGPNLDQTKPDATLAYDRVTNGKGGMPAWKGTLSDTQIADVVAYVSSATGS